MQKGYIIILIFCYILCHVLFIFPASDDYNASLSSSTVRIESATTRVDITFSIVDNSVYELTEHLFAELSFAPGVGFSRDSKRAQVNILDDDSMVYKSNIIMCYHCISKYS